MTGRGFLFHHALQRHAQPQAFPAAAALSGATSPHHFQPRVGAFLLDTTGACRAFPPQRTRTVHTTHKGHHESLQQGTNTLFILLGAIMGAGYARMLAFLNAGHSAQENLQRAGQNPGGWFAVSTAGVFHRLWRCLWHPFLGSALAIHSGYGLVKFFFFLLTFAAAIPAIVSGGIAERAKFPAPAGGDRRHVGFVYPSSRASPGTSILASRPDQGADGRRNSNDFASFGGGACDGRLDFPARRAAAGPARQPLPQRTAPSRPHPPLAFPFSPLARGSWWWAGSAST